ncbi:MAG: hypothetical protein M0Z43_12745 [Acidithiobacillus sp.]|jgi:hypothetical protein|nr:hypothetical protein [Acidithiobacillus sp.]
MDILTFKPVGTSVENALYYLGYSTDGSSTVHLFDLVTHPKPDMRLRDLEPLVGAVVRNASPIRDAQVLKESLRQSVDHPHWQAVRRGGYLLDLLCYFGPHQEPWQYALLPWLDLVASRVPTEKLIPFYPGDSRNNPLDSLARRWGLSSGVLYDRLNRLLRPPYVC